MSKSEIRGKHNEDATQLHRRSQSVSLTYKEGPQIRENGRAKAYAPVDKIRGHVSASRRRMRMTGCHVGPADP